MGPELGTFRLVVQQFNHYAIARQRVGDQMRTTNYINVSLLSSRSAF
jgi:hypothetical protein